MTDAQESGGPDAAVIDARGVGGPCRSWGQGRRATVTDAQESGGPDAAVTDARGIGPSNAHGGMAAGQLFQVPRSARATQAEDAPTTSDPSPTERDAPPADANEPGRTPTAGPDFSHMEEARRILSATKGRRKAVDRPARRERYLKNSASPEALAPGLNPPVMPAGRPATGGDKNAPRKANKRRRQGLQEAQPPTTYWELHHGKAQAGKCTVPRPYRREFHRVEMYLKSLKMNMKLNCEA